MIRTLCAALVLCATPVFAQQMIEHVNVDFIAAAPIAFDNETVTGAPYSAEAVTEVVQPLADGNRIVRQSKAAISRDSAGRTRREMGLSMIGPHVTAPQAHQQIQISDPEARKTIVLDMKDRTAHQIPAPHVGFGFAGKIAGVAGARVKHDEVFEMALPAPPAGDMDKVQMLYSSARTLVKTSAQPPAAETLGMQIIEGVEAEGTRTTFTIPAGEIGNEQPITVVHERWYSPELKVLVMSRQSDPRFGETTYRLTNITRVEPSPDLFQVPADFTLITPDTVKAPRVERKIIQR
jgi:hypothetical protein